MTATVKIALTGCGRISQNHFDAIRRVDGLELTGVCDIDESRARAAGEANGVPWFTTYDKMLTGVPSDAITICTPSGMHPHDGILAARAGKHVISEKPM